MVVLCGSIWQFFFSTDDQTIDLRFMSPHSTSLAHLLRTDGYELLYAGERWAISNPDVVIVERWGRIPEDICIRFDARPLTSLQGIRSRFGFVDGRIDIPRGVRLVYDNISKLTLTPCTEEELCVFLTQAKLAK